MSIWHGCRASTLPEWHGGISCLPTSILVDRGRVSIVFEYWTDFVWHLRSRRRCPVFSSSIPKRLSTCCFIVFAVPKKNSKRLCTCCIRFQSTATVRRLMSCSAARTTLQSKADPSILAPVRCEMENWMNSWDVHRFARSDVHLMNSFNWHTYEYLESAVANTKWKMISFSE